MRFLLPVLAVVLAGCATPSVPVPEWAGRMRNACVPEAAAMVQGLEGKNISARVLVFRAEGMRSGHAVAVYLYPSGANRLWVWDSTWGSVRVRAWWDDAEGIASAWLAAAGTRGGKIKRAEFLN